VAGAVDSKRQMSPTRTFGLREAMARAPSPIQIGVVGLAVLLAVAIFAVAVSAERFADAPLFLFAVPLALASVGWGLRGGVALGVLTSLLAAARASSRLELSESGGERRSWHHLQRERTP